MERLKRAMGELSEAEFFSIIATIGIVVFVLVELVERLTQLLV